MATTYEVTKVESSSTTFPAMSGLGSFDALSDLELTTDKQKGRVFDPTQVSGSAMSATTVVDAEGDTSATRSRIDAKRAAVLEQPSPGTLPDGHTLPLFAQIEEGARVEHGTDELKAKDSHAIQFRQISDKEIQLTDPRLPSFNIGGDEAFKVEIIRDLNVLLAVPETKEFLSELKIEAEKRGTCLQIVRGTESQIDHSRLDTENLMTVKISENKGRVICKKGDAYELEPMPSPINLVHELTHGYHMIRNEHSVESDTDGFDTKEERNTIGTVEDVHLQRFTENAYRAAFDMNLRVGHYGIQHEDDLTEDETIQALRSSIATGHSFAFLSPVDDTLIKGVYGMDMPLSAEKTTLQGYFRQDREKLLEHAKSTDPQKVQFAITMLTQFKPFIRGAHAQRQIQEQITGAEAHLAALRTE